MGRSFGGLVSRAGLAGGGAPNKDSYRRSFFTAVGIRARQSQTRRQRHLSCVVAVLGAATHNCVYMGKSWAAGPIGTKAYQTPCSIKSVGRPARVRPSRRWVHSSRRPIG
jgi:hypothetical protein